MAKKSCKKGYYYCYSSKKCKRIPMGYYVGGGGWLRKEEEKSEDTETKKNGNGNGANGNGNGNGGSDGGSNGGGVSEAWSAKYKKSIDCDNPKGFSQRAHCRGRKKVNEATMSPAQKRKDTMLKKKYDKSDMKQNMIDQYGKEEGTKIYFATIRKQAMEEESNPRIPRKDGQPANSKKHSDLYTDENPKGTIHGLGFKDVATAKASVAKIKKSSRSHAHKIQAAIAMEQRARVMGKTSEAAVFRKFINSMKKKTKQMNEAKGGDHEVAMAQSQLKKSEKDIKKIRKALGKKEKDIPAWMQAKVTDTAHNTDAVAGYVDKMDEEVIAEKRDGKSAKDKGYSLRDWFKGGGWVQAGGKYDGKPCAKQPGQKTKPYCRDADDRASMSKEERNKRARKKRKEDPNPNRKGKAKNVTQESYSNWRTELDEGLLGGLGLAAGAVAAYKAGKYLKRKGDEALDNARQNATLRGKPFGAGARQREIESKAGVKPGTLNPNMQRLRNSYQPEGEVVEGYDDGDVIRPTDRIRMKDGKLRTLKDLDAKLKDKETKKEEVELVDEGKKDACYHKVKSRYSVWPSAYASGALVKCRKVGAKNWGNKTKKEGFSNWREDMLLEGLEDKLRKMSPEQIEDLIKANKGAEQKIRDAIKNMRTSKSQGPGVQLPNIPKQPASTSSATSRETYQRGGSDRVSYQRRPRPARPSAPKSKKVGLAGKVLKTLSKLKNPRVAAMLGLGALSAGMFAAGMRGIKKKQQQNEGYDVSNWRDDFQATEYESVDIIKTEPLQPTQGLGSNMVEAKTKAERLKEISKQLAGASKMHAKQSKAVGAVADELEEAKKCWKGYKKAGTQKLFGKTYNRCVKAHFSDWRADMDLQEKESKPDYLDFDGDGNKEESMKKALKDKKKVKKEEVELQEAIPGYEKYNAAVAAAKGLKGRAKIEALKAAAELRPKTEKEVNQKLGEDWQKSNRNDGVDGMSQKSVNAYKRENPGSKLQTAVTEKKPTGKRAKRRTSFCARSKGQKDMHNIDCTKTPDKKICKARKRWRC